MNKVIAAFINSVTDENPALPTDILMSATRRSTSINQWKSDNDDLRNYRLPNLIQNFAKRLALQTLKQRYPNYPPIRMVVADFSKKPTKKQRLADAIVDSNKPGDGSQKKKGTKKKRISLQNKSKSASKNQIFMNVPSSGTRPNSALQKKAERRKSVISPDLLNRRKSIAPNRYGIDLERSSTGQLIYNRNEISTPRPRIKAKDFTENFKNAPTTSKSKQMKEIDHIMARIAEKDVKIARQTVERALLLPEDVVALPAKIDPEIEELLKKKAERPSPPKKLSLAPISPEELYSTRRRMSIASIQAGISPSAPSSYASPAFTPVIPMRRLPMYVQVQKAEEHQPLMLSVVEEKKSPKPKKNRGLTLAKMVVKPEEMRVTDSEPSLHDKAKIRTNCWWSVSEYKKLKRGYNDWKQKRDYQKEEERFQALFGKKDFKSFVPNRLPTPEIASKSSKYVKQAPSIEQLPIEPHATKNVVEYIQSTSQGKPHFRTQSHWLPSQSSISRPSSRGLFDHPDYKRTRSLSVGAKPTNDISNYRDAMKVILESKPQLDASYYNMYSQSIIKNKPNMLE